MADALTTSGYGLAAAVVLGIGGLAFFGEVTLLRDALIGVAVGTALGKLVVRRTEARRNVELSARRVRQIEASWTTAIGCLAVVGSLMVELL